MNKSDSLKMRIRPICLLQINEEEKSRSMMIKAVISSEEKCQGLESHGETFHTEFVLCHFTVAVFTHKYSTSLLNYMVFKTFKHEP